VSAPVPARAPYDIMNDPVMTQQRN